MKLFLALILRVVELADGRRPLFRLKLLPLMGALDIIYVMILTSFPSILAAAQTHSTTVSLLVYIVTTITTKTPEFIGQKGHSEEG